MPVRSINQVPHLTEVSQLFKILGNPKRLQLLYLLIQHSMSVTEISESLNWEQSGVSHQLQLLRKYNLVQQRRKGKVVIYHLDDPQVVVLIADVLSHAERIVTSEH
ncbi:ArsR/SmtB family transcription factor [Limosilactobacillus sp.]|jgi:DNA-binding transcriptional ArsR family regulator|uniref:ArsR/SmtB family transcription factor n=1 Tax=Limosilactobacillus sp. TaxID=2773925 RepID=UPI0025BE6D73|nr:metalloregulator ArsR/SmtB family transcription factor [Limosilactobacillus sp.]MCH3921541.1 metalloregulator ArsR/SmtB family transcription factor [Limosilactobacillus sp.]MCH3928312.1 metalloregulator ArsR/SmtB family transcription factor [Limosilactobacillus sp.]